MQEPSSRLFTDSLLTEPFSTRSTSFINGTVSRNAQMWFIGPAIVFFIIALIVGMLIFWWLRCSRRVLLRRHCIDGQSINKDLKTTKVVLSSTEFNKNNVIVNGLPTESSKLLLGMDSEGRPIMNSYEVKNEFKLFFFLKF